jgi:hypothetical protein
MRLHWLGCLHPAVTDKTKSAGAAFLMIEQNSRASSSSPASFQSLAAPSSSDSMSA